MDRVGRPSGAARRNRRSCSCCRRSPRSHRSPRSSRGTPIAVGAQNLSTEDGGAHTGEVSGADAVPRPAAGTWRSATPNGARCTARTRRPSPARPRPALRNGLVPVLCVGEPRRVPAFDAAAECTRQLASALRTAPDGTGDGRVRAGLGDRCRPARRRHAHRGGLRRAPRPAGPSCSVIYGGSAGPGLLTRLGRAVDGLFLGRFAHDPAALVDVLDEAAAVGCPA